MKNYTEKNGDRILKLITEIWVKKWYVWFFPIDDFPINRTLNFLQKFQ